MKGTAREDALIGTVIGGRYRVLKLIGEGGMGAIYEVAHTRINRHFALKTLAGQALGNEEAFRRFRREADVVAGLRHPNIVTVVDWEELEDGSPCMVLELLQGEDLGQRLRRTGPLRWSEVGRIGDQVVSALMVAHQAGIVHRDLKPENVFLARDDAGGELAKLLDFGISKVKDSKTFATTNERLMGTPAYMSPEQIYAKQAKIDASTDMWAMGAMLYEMATGNPAFEADSIPAMLYRICHDAADPVSQHRADAPPAFDELVSDLLSHDADRRITSAEVARVRLRSALADVVQNGTFTPTAGAAHAAAAPAAAAVPPLSESGRGIPREVDSKRDITGGNPTVAATSASIPELDIRPPPTPPAPSSPRRTWVPIAALTVVGGALAAFVLASGPEPSPPAVAQSDQPAAVEQAKPEPPPEPEPSAPAAAESEAGARPAEAPEPPATVTLNIDTKPSGASVERDGQPLGTTPLELPVPRDSSPTRLVFQKPGFATQEIVFDTHADQTRLVKLQRRRATSRPRPTGSRPKPADAPKPSGSKKRDDPENPY